MGEQEQRKGRGFFRAKRARWIVAGSLLALVIAGWWVIARINAGLKSQLETTLSAAFGRPVTVERAVLTRAITIERITVPGDGDIDTGFFLVLAGVRAYPNFLSLIRMNPTIDLVTVDSAILNARYSDEKGWSLKGLFPSAPTAEPRLGKLLMPKTTINCDANGQMLSRTLNVNIVLGRYGDYTCRFNEDRIKGKFMFTGSEEKNPVYSLAISLESIPIMARPESIRLTTEFREVAKQVSFDIATSLRGTPARLAGALTFDHTSVKSDSAFWEYGAHRGDLVASVDDFANKRFQLSTTGTMEFDAAALGERFSAGRIALDGASVAGGLKGIWEIKGKARATGVTMTGDPQVEDLSGEIEFRAAISDTLQITPAQYNGSLRFAKASSGRNIIQKSDIRFTGSGRTIELTGSAQRFEAAATRTEGSRKPSRSPAAGRIVRIPPTDRMEEVPRAPRMAQERPKPPATAFFPDIAARGEFRRIPARAVELRKFKIGFNSKWELIELGGGIRVAGLDGRMLGIEKPDFSLDRLDVDMKNVGIRKEGTRWNITRITGTVEHAQGAYLKSEYKIGQASIDLTEGPAGISGSFDGQVEALGGRGNINATLLGSTVKKAKMSFEGLDIDAARTLKPSEQLDRVAKHIRTIDLDGTAEFTDATPGGDPAGLRFFGTASSRRVKLAPPDDPELPGNLHEVTLKTALFAPENKDLPVMLDSAIFSIDNKTTRIFLAKTPLKFDQISTRINIERINFEHLRAAARIFVSNKYTELLSIDGVMKGSVDLEKRGDAYSAEVNCTGNLRLRGAPLDFTVTGRLTDIEPTLLVNISRVSPEAINQSLGDLDSSSERGVMEWKGSAGANMTVIGSWSDVNIEGTLLFQDASVLFPERKILFSGINGEVPFRLQKAKLLALGELESKKLDIERLTWADFIVRDIECHARFNEKALHFDKIGYTLAEARGRGAFVIDFPTWDKPRTAFIGEISGCSVGIVYRTMQPFAGRFEGSASAKMEIKTSGTDLTGLSATIHIDTGVLGSDLLRGVVNEMAKSVIKEALLSLVEWNFSKADLKFDYVRSYYSRAVARNKFGEASKLYEVLGNINVVGPVYPLDNFRILNMIRPFNFLGINVDLHVTDVQMRLLMDRVGRKES